MNSEREGNSRIAVNTILLTIRMFFVMAIGLYSTRVVLRVLGASDYGIYNVVGGFVSMFAFINTSMSNGIQRFYNYALGRNSGKSLSDVYSTAISIQLIIAFLVFILTETLGLWYLYQKMVIPPDRFHAALYCFHFSVVSLVLGVFQLPYMAMVMARERMNFYAIVSILDALIKLIIVIALPHIEYDQLIVYGFLLMIISLVDLLLYFFYVKHHYNTDTTYHKPDKELFKDMLSFSGWNCFGSFGVVMCSQGLNLILNFFFGTVVNAARGIAFQISGACKSFVFNITTASRPQMIQSYAEGNHKRSLSIMESMSKLCFLSLFILALPVVVEIDFILRIWLGSNIPEYTKIFTLLILSESLIGVFNPPVSFMVHATGKMKKYQLLTTCVSLTVLPVAYFLMKLGLEPYFVFIASLFFTSLCQIVSVYILRALLVFSVKGYLQKVIIPMAIVVLLSSLIPLLVHIVMDSGWLRLIIVVLCSIICVLFSAFFVGLNSNERSVVLSFVSL